MNTKYIGLDIDSKKTVVCVVQQGQKDRYTTFQSNLPQMPQYLQQERQDGSVVHLMNLLEELKLLTILRAMLRTGELFNEELVSAEKAREKQTVNPQNHGGSWDDRSNGWLDSAIGQQEKWKKTHSRTEETF